MAKFTAVIGKSKSNRIISVEAPDEDAARVEIQRQLHTNPQRRDIWRQWQADGATVVADSPTPTFDEAQANAQIRRALRSLLAEMELGVASRSERAQAIVMAARIAHEALNAFDEAVVA